MLVGVMSTLRLGSVLISSMFLPIRKYTLWQTFPCTPWQHAADPCGSSDPQFENQRASEMK